MTAAERIEFLVVFYKTTVKAFSEIIGFERPQALYDIQKGKTKNITEKLANRIVSVFSEVSKAWLLTGSGDPFETAYNRILAILRREKSNYKELERGSSDVGNLLTRGRIFEHALKNPGDPQVLNNWIKTLTERYSLYSEDWILTGEGPVFKDGRSILPTRAFTTKTDRLVSTQDVPLYEYSATAGLVAIFNDHALNPTDFLKIPNLPPVDGAIYVRGESMSPLLKSGDIVMFKKKELSIDNILWGEIYLLSFVSDGDPYTAVKYIHKADLPDYVRLVSFNPSFAPKDIPMSSITALALVKASLTFHTME